MRRAQCQPAACWVWRCVWFPAVGTGSVARRWGACSELRVGPGEARSAIWSTRSMLCQTRFPMCSTATPCSFSSVHCGWAVGEPFWGWCLRNDARNWSDLRGFSRLFALCSCSCTCITSAFRNEERPMRPSRCSTSMTGTGWPQPSRWW